MEDDIKLPPMPYPYDTPAYRTVGAVIQDYARSAIKADRQRRGEQVAPPSDDNSLTIAYMCGYNHVTNIYFAIRVFF